MEGRLVPGGYAVIYCAVIYCDHFYSFNLAGVCGPGPVDSIPLLYWGPVSLTRGRNLYW